MDRRPRGQMSQFGDAGASAVSPFASTDLPAELPLAPLTSADGFVLEDGASNFKSESKGRTSGALSFSFTALGPCCPSPGCDGAFACMAGGTGPEATGRTLRRRVSSSTQRYMVLEMPSSTRNRSSIASRVSTSN
jgi:hypothetical protein